MERVAVGKLNKVIADELGIAMRTVEVHRARVFTKLEVRSAAELAALLARQRGVGSRASQTDGIARIVKTSPAPVDGCCRRRTTSNEDTPPAN
jgi:hypothetical protein